MRIGEGSTHKNYFRTLSNRQLLYTNNKLRKEERNKEQYGDYGTGRYISSNEFYGRQGKAQLRQEIERRRKLGLLSKTAGKKKVRQRQQFKFGGGFQIPRLRF